MENVPNKDGYKEAIALTTFLLLLLVGLLGYTFAVTLSSYPKKAQMIDEQTTENILNSPKVN